MVIIVLFSSEAANIKSEPEQLAGPSFMSFLIEINTDQQTSISLKEESNENSNQRNLKCEICGKQFKMQTFFNKHVKRHAQCTICKKYFKYDHQLKKHMFVHATDKPVTCSLCGKGYKNEKHLSHHMRVHAPPENVSCPICNKILKRAVHLKAHIAAQHPISEPGGEIRAYECFMCKRPQKSEVALRTHMYDHLRKKYWLCPQCGKRFAAESLLKLHLMRDDHNVRGEILKPYQCQVCHRRFTTLYKQTEHSLIHTDKRLFSCKVCGKAFATSGYLSQHKIVHMEKRFQCNICGHKSRSPGNLRKHMVKHIGKSE